MSRQLFRIADWMPRLVARIPASIHAKLLAAFLAIAVLLVAVGTVGLRALSEANHRQVEVFALQRKVTAYRQLQHDTTGQLYSVTDALLVPQQGTLDAAVRQLVELGYDFDRLRFVAQDEAELIGQVEDSYNQLIRVTGQVVSLIRAGKIAEGQELQLSQAGPIADRLERLTNQLLNRAEADMIARIDDSQSAYAASQWVIVGCALASVVLALVLGYAIAWSLLRPLKEMEVRLREIAAGDFSQHVVVSNRDELGSLAGNLNQMSTELARLYAELEAMSRRKSEFLANMSHELRTPLNAIIGFSDVLTERLFGDLNDKQAEYLDDILSSGRHLLSLINDILDLSKIEAGRMELDVGTFWLPEVLETSFTVIRERAARHHIRLDLQLDPGIGMLTADERKIKQVIFNLLSNAVKFTPEGGRVQLTAHQMDGYLQIGVHDTGIGIAPEDQARIFEEFQQARGARPDATEGTGLGLALARRFVELHGGALWVESAVGAGSTFTLTLPSDLSVAQRLQVDLNGPAPLPAEVPVRSRRRT